MLQILCSCMMQHLMHIICTKNHSNYFRESYKTYTFAVSEFENEAFLMPRTDGQ